MRSRTTGLLILLASAQADAITVDWDASVRLRSEVKQGLDFNDAEQDYSLLRTRVGADFALDSQWSLTAELQDARVFDVDAGTIPGVNDQALDQPFADDLDVHRLSLNYKVGDVQFTLGRQKLNLGDKRLVASLEWVNTARVHEGLRIDYRSGDLAVNAFATELVSIDPNSLNDGADTGNRYFDSQFNGVFWDYKGLADVDVFQAWWLQRRNSNVDDDVHTLGFRVQERFANWTVDAQASLQTGDFGGDDHQAASAHISFSHPLADGIASLSAAWASGDDDPNDGDHQTFDNLYPLNHAYYGYLDLVSLQNIRAVELNYQRAILNDRLKLRAALHGFWLDDKNDAWYEAGLKPVAGLFVEPSRVDVDERFLGTEIDLTVQYDLKVKALDGLSVLAGYSRFNSEDRVQPDSVTGHISDADFVYVQVSLKL